MVAIAKRRPPLASGAEAGLHDEIAALLRSVGPGRTSCTAYDTAWLARLYKVDPAMSERALVWLRRHQLADGSWGAGELVHHHDRTISTLAALIALAERGLSGDETRVRRGLRAVERHARLLSRDPSGETIAFEMLAPMLMAEANRVGLECSPFPGITGRLAEARDLKLGRSPRGVISRQMSMSFSAEMAGSDGTHLLDLANLQEVNGSIGYSPSATAYYLLMCAPENRPARHFLQLVAHEGGLPDVGPITVFEPAWVLWNLSLAGAITPGLMPLCRPFVDLLEAAWNPARGIGTAVEWSLTDGDDTGLVYDVLRRFDRSVELDGVLHYEEAGYFRCFQLEANPSLSANIHVLGALRQAGLRPQHPSVNKIRRFLWQHRQPTGYWIDKWHASPYYATGHLALVTADYLDPLAEAAVDWILNTQNDDGSWGYFGPTAEETAYSLQALALWMRGGRPVPVQAIRRGATWLAQHADPPYPSLWIGKCLYTPPTVVRSAVLSALFLAHQILGAEAATMPAGILAR